MTKVKIKVYFTIGVFNGLSSSPLDGKVYEEIITVELPAEQENWQTLDVTNKAIAKLAQSFIGTFERLKCIVKTEIVG